MGRRKGTRPALRRTGQAFPTARAHEGNHRHGVPRRAGPFTEPLADEPRLSPRPGGRLAAGGPPAVRPGPLRPADRAAPRDRPPAPAAVALRGVRGAGGGVDALGPVAVAALGVPVPVHA